MPAENTEKPALPPLPYTNRRGRVARAMLARQVKHWHFIQPETHDLVTGAVVTETAAELVLAGIASYGEKTEFNTSLPFVTPAGEEWLKTYGGTE